MQDKDEQEFEQEQSSKIQDWMLICQYNAEFSQDADDEQDCDWLNAARAYPDVLEMPSFLAQQRQQYTKECVSLTADPAHLQGKQLKAYSIVREHFEVDNSNRQPLTMVVSGTAGTGKSYLIQCLKLLLKEQLIVAAPTGVAAFNVDGYTLHLLLSLPIKGDFKPLEGKRLQTIQQTLSDVKYIIIDEMSMVGRKVFGQIDRRLRQVFPHGCKELFGGCSCLLFGDWGQLPPVMDLPLYSITSRSELSNLGSANYHLFDRVVILDRVMRQAGHGTDQELFRDLLLRLRNGASTEDDWRRLMNRTQAEIGNVSIFDDSLRLYPTVEAVAEYNVAQLHARGQPIATIKAVHTGPDASRASNDDAGGLEPVVCLAHGARVMLCANLWVEVGLVNGALGTVVAICYANDHRPPNLPIAVTVKFDSYSGPALPDGTVPICPLFRNWYATTKQCSRLQLPLKLAWAITIHKSQGLTLDKAVINVGKKEFSSGLTFVACSRVRRLTDLLFVPPFSYQRLANLSKSSRLKDRVDEDARLERLATNDIPPHPSLSPSVKIIEPPVKNIKPPSADDDEEVIFQGSLSRPPCLFKYNPVDEDWRQRTCRVLGLRYEGPNGVTPGGTEVCLTKPVSLKRIAGDGNCFYRSISFIITGSQSQRLAVRQAIVDQMRIIGDRLIGDPTIGIERYIQSNKVERNGSWATEVEIYALSHLLRTCIYSYIVHNRDWWCINPGILDATLTSNDISEMGIYINHPRDHFDVVQSVSPCDVIHATCDIDEVVKSQSIAPSDISTRDPIHGPIPPSSCEAALPPVAIMECAQVPPCIASLPLNSASPLAFSSMTNSPK